MTRSTFYCDGYRDAEQGNPWSPPAPSIYYVEYQRGYNAFFNSDSFSARYATTRAKGQTDD